MKQVYAAGPRADRPSVSAASPGVRPDELDAVLTTAGYAATDGRSVRLALLNTPGGRLLTHVSPTADGFVAHALVDVPPSADAQAAIQTWGSPQWQRHAPEAAADLPELPYLPVADVLDDDSLKGWLLTSPARRDLLEFVFAALLSTPADARLVVAATADDVAKTVYAVTRALPPGMLDDFTFSTYEPDPAGCPARLVGADPGRPLGDEFFAPGGRFVGFDPATGRRAEVPEVPFAAFAVDAIAADKLSKLDELKAFWQRLGLSDPRQFDLVYRLGRGAGVLTKAEAADAVQYPPLAAWLSTRPDAVNQFLDWALEDRDFATRSFPRMVQALRQKPDVTTKLGQTVRDRGIRSLKEGDRDQAATALEVVLPMVAPSKAGGVWGELLGSFADPDALPWPMRCYLLPKFARFRQQQGQAGVDPALARWLAVPTDRLADLLQLDLPKAYHHEAARAALGRDGEPTDELARAVGGHPALAMALLKPDVADEARAAGLFERLLATTPGTGWLDEAVAAGDDYPAPLRSRFLDAALAADAFSPEQLARTRGPRVLELFAGQAALDRFGSRLLATPPDDLLWSAPLADFLDQLAADPAAGDVVKARVAAVQTARQYLTEPTFAPDRMAMVADALRLSPPVLPAAAKDAVFKAVVEELARRPADGDGYQADLEAVLSQFGGVLATGPADLAENLLRELRAKTDMTRRAGPTTAFLAVCLGAAKGPELAGKLDGLDGPAFALASEAARKGGSKLLDEVDANTREWPAPARAQWGFLRTAVKPAGTLRYVRDAQFFVIGSAAASLAWYFFGR